MPLGAPHTSRQPLLTFSNARDEAAFVLFVANNTRLCSARVRCVTALIWFISLSQFLRSFVASPVTRKPVHLLRFAFVLVSYLGAIVSQLHTALYLFQAEQASIRSLVLQERRLLRCALVAGYCSMGVIVLLETGEAGIAGALVSVMITNYVDLFDQVRMVEYWKLAVHLYVCFAVMAASTTLFKPRLRPTAGHLLQGSPVGAFVADLGLGAVVAFLVPMVLTMLWEAHMRAWFLSTNQRPHASMGPFWAWLLRGPYASDAPGWERADGSSSDAASPDVKPAPDANGGPGVNGYGGLAGRTDSSEGACLGVLKGGAGGGPQRRPRRNPLLSPLTQ